ncbi:hypothetical protein HF638_00225 [Paenibacillus sp. SZ31]|uniref:hypothetical protein n=1 Tax=Paenibacillus sp. SZ31 TaxID=2725555 RepID=UPI00146A0EB9|nr:hypothetical protein [Paenibacillus sp. SZ31]NMI02380.1 hypothetical protein [Paenibacillus sp. SZ31]
MKYSNKVDWCSCNQGWIEIKKNSRNGQLFFKCSECMAEFNLYEDINRLARDITRDENPLDPSNIEIIKHEYYKLIIKEWENKYLIRNDNKVIKKWNDEKREFERI